MLLRSVSELVCNVAEHVSSELVRNVSESVCNAAGFKVSDVGGHLVSNVGGFLQILWKRLNHRPPVKVGSINVFDIRAFFFAVIVVAHVLVVCFCITFRPDKS